MDLSPLSNIQKTTKIERTQAKAAVQNLERNDQISISEGTLEAKKIANWVHMLKEMPEEIPSHLERGIKSADVLLEVSKKLAEEIPSFLTQRP